MHHNDKYTPIRHQLRTDIHLAKMTIHFMPNARGAVVRWLGAAWLQCRKTPEGREFEAGFRYPTTEKLSMPTQQ